MMQTDAKHMSEAGFVRHLLMAGAGGGRKCNSVPPQKLPYLVRWRRLPVLGVLGRKVTEGEVEAPENKRFCLQREGCTSALPPCSAHAGELALLQA